MDDNLKYTLLSWNSAYGELQNEEDSLDFYRTSYEDEISRTKLEQVLSSLDTWISYAYKNKLLFQITALFADNDQPYADILFNDGNVIITFIDNHNRKYLSYTFGGNHNPNRLFLESIHYFIYSEDIKEFTNDDIKDVEYIFTPEGKLTVWERYLEDGKWYENTKEAIELINVESNWEEYPKLGEYDSIVRLERWRDGELNERFKGSP